MKNLIYLFILLLSLFSCEKSQYEPQIMNFDSNTRILNGYFVTSMAFDNNGNAWIGTFKQGLIKYSTNGLTIYNAENSILTDSSVIHDISIDSKNNIWIGCDGLVKFDGSRFYKYNSSNTPIPEDYVSSIEIDSKNNIWFTSSRFRQGGVVKYDGLNWNVYTPDNSGLPVHSVRSIAIDKNDNVWLALSEMVNDACLVKIANHNWTIYTSDDLGFSPYYFGNIRINSKNELCGAIDYSLSSTYSNLGPQVFVFDGEPASQLQFDSLSNIKSISIDKADNIWCAGYGILAVFNGKEWTTDETTFKENGVFAIEQSPDGKIWIGTGDGIFISE
ncbi:MAG: hypothetical protein K9H49_02670 [Bacteroidales bacterium]|nr:hypothetical protein [Bacteroidales bacterium]MCF8389161.1 hypothetical protein [Bacteroidales bacterium]